MFGGVDPYVFIVYYNSNSGSSSLSSGRPYYLTAALRPSIALKSTTTINGGDGTASNPYVIED